jgi:serine/threonine protein kinase/tetratricopeptide (TPR) repeat protein/TolB-like protein
MPSQRSDDWRRVREVFEGALTQPAEQRRSFVAEACRDAPEIEARALALLASHDRAGTFLERPAAMLLKGVAGAGAAADHAIDPNIGRSIGSYRIESRIGHGGMGAVYLARRADQAFERLVAIKMIRRGMDSDVVIRRFHHERQILASLDHPYIARLFDGGTTPEGLPYFVMEYVEGTPIDRYAEAQRLDTAQRIELCLKVLDAVQHAHDHHIVHRDLKPSNVLVAATGAPKLLDFGIAKILDPDVQGDSTLTSLARAMTPDYASPEQVRGEPVTPATDVYALGLLLYELLTGRRPFSLTTRTPDEIARIVCEQDPQKPSAVVAQAETTTAAQPASRTTTAETSGATRQRSPQILRKQLAGALDAIVLKALRKEPAERYPTVGALADDLRRYLADRPVTAARDAVRYRMARAARRHRGAAGIAATLVAAVAATAFLVRQPLTPDTNTTTAAVAARTRASVAVVPFRNLSGRADDEWLSTALAEMLATELVADGQVRVLPADDVERAAREVGGAPPSAGDDAAYERLRTHLRADYLVAGTFAVADRTPSRSLRIDVRAHRGRGDPIAVDGVGDEGQLFAVVAAAGHGLRQRLGLRESSPEATSAARAAYPRTLEATRLYAEGLARLRLLNAVAARDLLERANASEPGNPLVLTALASAWTALGYDGRAADAAQKAFDGSAGLDREDRLNAEGRLAEARQNWTKASDVYRTLWGFFSDNAEYGLRFASAQRNAGHARESIETLRTIRRLPPPQGNDPRIDLAEAQAQSALGNFKQELAALQRGASAAESSGARLMLARARLLEGRSYYNQGQPQDAERALRAAEATFAEVGDKAGVASAFNSLGSVVGDWDSGASEKLYLQALAISEEIGDLRGMSATLNNLGIRYKDLRQFDLARRTHERALALRREIGDRQWEAVSLSNIGVVLFEQDHFTEAGRYYRDSLAICREIGDKRGLIRALHNLAIVDREMGNLSAARKSLEESLEARAEIGDRRGIVMGRVELGTVLLEQGELGQAQAIEEQAVAVARETRLKAGEANALFQLARIALARGDVAEAREQHERALALRRETNEARTVAESEAALAALDLEEGRPADAERRARAVLREVGSSAAGPLPVLLQLLMARASIARGDVAGAGQLVGAARRAAAKTERLDVRTALAMTEAELQAASGHPSGARTVLAALRAQLAKSRMPLADLDARLLLLRLTAGDQPSNVEADARALETDARARGAGLIVRRAQALRQSVKSSS